MKNKEEFITEEKVINTPAGGVLIGKDKDGQTIIPNDGSLGGFLVGRLHKDGGIKAVNKGTGQPLEMQSNEIVITAPAVADTTKREFEGKMMTNREILSKINSDGGGVSFADGGDIPAKIHTTDKEYEYGGKMLHDTDIAHSLGMNSTLKKGKQQFSLGDSTYDVDAIYNAIKKGKLRLKTKEVETFPMKYSVYDKNYADNHKIDFRKPNGITVRTESGEEVLIDGNHRMNNAYSKGRKTMKTYYVEDPKQIAKFTKKNKFELGGENKDGGHLSKNKSLKQIAEMHKVSLAHINEQLAKGLEVEKEHFSDFKERTRVAKDHLVENPNYYTILAKAGLKRGGKIEKEDLVEDAKSGNTPARDLNNYNDLLDVQADGAVGGDSGLAFAKGGQVSNFFKKKYGNLVEKKGIITTKTDWFNKDGVKVLQYGFDPYRHEQSNTLFYYSWDYDDSGMDYDDFRNQLVDFFEKTYKKDVSELKALYVGWDRKEKDTYTNGGVAPYDANLEGDSVDIVENGFAKGGVVYDTTKPKIEKITIKDTKSNRTSVIGRNASTISEFQQIVSDYIGNTPKEDVDWINFYVNDSTRGSYYIDLNKGKKNTVKNVNPETLNSLNFKRVIDAKAYLVKNYDWTDFFELGGQKKSGKDNSVIRIAITYDSQAQVKSGGMSLAESTVELYNFLRGLHNGDYKNVKIQPIGNGLGVNPIELNLSTLSWDNILTMMPEENAVKEINKKLYGLFPELNFDKFITDYVLSTSTQTQYPEYYEYIAKESMSFTTGKIYKIVNPKDIEAGQNFIDNDGIPNGFSGDNGKKFKPSTEEAYLAQQTPVSNKEKVKFLTVSTDEASKDVFNISELKKFIEQRYTSDGGADGKVELYLNGDMSGGSWKITYGDGVFCSTCYDLLTHGSKRIKDILLSYAGADEFDWSDFFEEAKTLNSNLVVPKIVDAVNVEFVYPNGRIEASTTINISNLKNALANFWNMVDKKSWEVRITPFENQFTPFEEKKLIIGSDFAEYNPETFSEEQLGNKLKTLYPDLDWSIFLREKTITSNRVVPKTIKTSVYDLDSAVNKLEKASSTVATEYNKDIYDKSLKFLYDTKATYELALKFTPESAFMYERLDLMKKLADIEKNIKKIEDMKKGGTFYMLAKIIERLQRGENWRMLEQSQDVITNQIPQSEIDVIIRSQKFKNWFGDWEKALVNDEYDNVSKALTDGIPSVYHHGARRIKYTYREVSNGVLYLAENISYATWFSQNATAQTEEGNYLTECFVNIKNPIDLTAFHVNKVDLADIVRYVDAVYPMAKIYDFIPAQVALLIKTNQPTNVRMWAWQLIRSYAKFVNHIKENTPYDGFLYYENNPSDQVMNPVTGQLEENVTKAVAIFKSYQVKVVDAVLFDGGLDDWRFENGGKIKN